LTAVNLALDADEEDDEDEDEEIGEPSTVAAVCHNLVELVAGTFEGNKIPLSQNFGYLYTGSNARLNILQYFA